MFFPLAAASAGAWLFTAQAYNYKQKQDVPLENKSQKSNEKEPYYGAWDHQRHWLRADTRGRFVKVVEDYDVQGAKIFLVDYGNGARVVQYNDPRIQL
jgi:hypothetical protein